MNLFILGIAIFLLGVTVARNTKEKPADGQLEPWMEDGEAIDVNLKESTKMIKNNALPNKPGRGITMIPGNDFNQASTDGYWGDWGFSRMCPEGQFVYGYRIRSEVPQRYLYDDTALNDIELRCAAKGSRSYTTIHSKHGTRGTWYPGGNKYVYCSGTEYPVVGFVMKIQPKQGLMRDDTAANDIHLFCKYPTYPGSISADIVASQGIWTNRYKCPPGQAVIGIVTRVDTKNYDNTALNGVRLYCKKY